MALGRGFLISEEREKVIVLGHRLWEHRFASDPAIIGKAVTLSGHPYTVVGVAPVGFHGLDLILDSQFWVPLGTLDALVPNAPNRDARDDHWLAVVGRLNRGIATSQAAAELNTLAQSYAKIYSATDKDTGFYLDPAGSLPPREKTAVLLFLAALSVVVLLVLGIACANVANLLLAHATNRQREMAVRVALGAARSRLLRQMLFESMLLALGGGLLGVMLSLWATSALAAFHVPAPVPLDMTLTIDWRVLLYTFLLSVGAGLLFGAVPALTVVKIASRSTLTTALKGEEALARPGRHINLRNILVVAQIAMSIVPLSVTGLFLRSLGRASSIETGFRSHDLLMVSIDPRIHGYTPERTTQFLKLLRERVGAIPGVMSDAATDNIPLNGGNRSDGMVAEGHPKSSAPIVEMYMAGPGYFETLGIPRIAGRGFSNEPPAGAKVAVINQVLAQQLFPGENPIGQHVRDGNDVYEIVGVVGNIKSRFINEDNRPVLFRSLAQTISSDPSLLGYTLVVHSRGDTASLVSAIRRQIRALDPSLAVYNVETSRNISAAISFCRVLARHSSGSSVASDSRWPWSASTDS
jgi:predicted permease